MCYNVFVSNEGKEKQFTVKEAAELTNYSIPYFYSALGRERLGVAKGTVGRGWLISQNQLIQAGMLSSDGLPVRHPGKSQKVDSFVGEVREGEFFESLQRRVSELEELLTKERGNNSELRSEIAQKDAQIEVLRELIIQLKGK